MSVFDKSVKEGYERLARQEIEVARYVRDTINKSDDTKKVYKLLTELQQTYESRVLLDSGEGRHGDGREYTEKDFWINIGEVRGLRWLATKVKALTKKADDEDEADRRRNSQSSIIPS